MKKFEFGKTEPVSNGKSHLDGVEEVARRNLTSVEGEPVHLPVEIPVKAAGQLVGVDFEGEGVVRIIGYTDEEAHERKLPEWMEPFKDRPQYLIYIDKRAGQMAKIVLGSDLLGWWRAKKPGRLGSSSGVNIAILPTRYTKDGKYYDNGIRENPGWIFFDAGKYNILLEFLLNKIMGWTIWNREDVWNLLTADTAKLGIPKEIWAEKRNFREHFLPNQYNKWQIFPDVRARMGRDPAKMMPELYYMPYFMHAEDAWIDRYVLFASALERFVNFEHPECANLFPNWTADAMATKAVNMLYRVQDSRDRPEFRVLDCMKIQQIELWDIAGNIVGLAESVDMIKPKYIFCPEHAADALVGMRKTDIDSPLWLKYDSGVEFVNKRNEFYELLLEGRLEEAGDARKVMHDLYITGMKSKARTEIVSRFAKDLSKREDYIANLEALVLSKASLMCGWDLLLAYVSECVRRGLWKPVKVSPLRIARPPATVQ